MKVRKISVKIAPEKKEPRNGERKKLQLTLRSLTSPQMSTLNVQDTTKKDFLFMCVTTYICSAEKQE